MKVEILKGENQELSGQIADLINIAYDFDEAGLWLEGATRTSDDEVLQFIRNGELFSFQDEKGQVIGCLRAKALEQEEAEISMVSVALNARGKGIPGQLMSMAENTLKEQGFKKSVIELLVPRHWKHPKKQQLFSWYQNRGYKLFKKDPFEKYFPEAEKFLATQVDFLVMKKDLRQAIEPRQSCLITEQLNEQILQKLFSRKLDVIIVRNFCSNELSERIAAKLQEQKDIEQFNYVISDKDKTESLFLGVSRLGKPHSSTFKEETYEKNLRDYQKMALPMLNRIRSYAAPYLSPMDKLRVELDENWTEGANLANFEGFKMFSGIVRYTAAEADLSEKAHVDSLPPSKAFQGQFAANVYLKTPSKGGELLLWPQVGFLTPEQVHSQEAHDYLWSLRKEDALKVHLKAGDLVLFPTQIPHAIGVFSEGERLSLQTFLALDEQNRINVWS